MIGSKVTPAKKAIAEQAQEGISEDTGSAASAAQFEVAQVRLLLCVSGQKPSPRTGPCRGDKRVLCAPRGTQQLEQR